MKKIRGIYFTFDGLIAVGIMLLAVFLASSFYIKEQQKVNVNYAAQDIIVLFSSLKVGDIKTDYVQRLINSSDITNENLTILEQIGDFWAQDKIELGKNFTKNLTEDIFPSTYGFSVLVNDDLIHVRNTPVTRTLVSTRKIVSGIAKAKPTDGFTSRVLLAGIKSKKTSAYAYFGGYEGDGNLTKKIKLPDKIISIDSAYLELDTGGKFNLYINNIPSGTYVKGSGGGGNMLADKWNINGAYLSNFKTGENIININFTSGKSYIAGGFLRVTYITNVTNDTKKAGIERYLLPGINGIVNLYSSIYIPSTPDAMNISLHFKSDYPTYLDIGNATVYETNGSSAEQLVKLNNSNLTKVLNFSKLIEMTLPLRFGLRNISAALVSGITTVLNFHNDAVLMTDRSSTMKSCDVDVPCGTPGICNPGACKDRRITVAANADNKFIDVVLNNSNNRVALTGFGPELNPTCDIADLTNDANFLKGRIGIYDEDNICAGTCGSCVIVQATELLMEKRSLYGMNELFSINQNQVHLGDSKVSTDENFNVNFDSNKFIKSRLQILGKNAETEVGYRDCIYLNDLYIGRMCQPHPWHTCYFPIKNAWLVPNGNNKVTVTGGTKTGCLETSGTNDEWDFKDVSLSVWESPTVVPTSQSASSNNQINLGSGTKTATVALNFNTNNVNVRAATLEFDATGTDPSKWDCIFLNDNYVGKIDYQRWDGTANWQPVILDVPALWIKNGANSVKFTAGSADRCIDNSGNDDWSLKNIKLTLTQTNEGPFTYDGNQSMVFMGDGILKRMIGDDNPSEKDAPVDEAVAKACEARQLYGIHIFGVEFGKGGKPAVIKSIACCDDCSHFFEAGDAQALYDAYANIANIISNTSSSSSNSSSISFNEQTVNTSGQKLNRTLLFSDSYIEFNYSSNTKVYFNRIPLSFETNRFGNDVSSGTLTVYPNTTIQDALVTSYSESKWTDNLAVNGNNAFRLSDYGKNYQILGDPFSVNIPVSKINTGGNDIVIGTGIDPANPKGGSKDDKVIYTLLLKGVTDYTNVLPLANGCSWSVEFADGTSSTFKIPSGYTGAEECDFAAGTYDNTDALDISVFQLFSNLDLDKDGKLDVKIDESSLNVESLTISKVPSLWGPAIIEIRVWE